jgi:hypothetical protein
MAGREREMTVGRRKRRASPNAHELFTAVHLPLSHGSVLLPPQLEHNQADVHVYPPASDASILKGLVRPDRPHSRSPLSPIPDRPFVLSCSKTSSTRPGKRRPMPSSMSFASFIVRRQRPATRTLLLPLATRPRSRRSSTSFARSSLTRRTARVRGMEGFSGWRLVR